MMSVSDEDTRAGRKGLVAAYARRIVEALRWLAASLLTLGLAGLCVARVLDPSHAPTVQEGSYSRLEVGLSHGASRSDYRGGATVNGAAPTGFRPSSGVTAISRAASPI